MRYSRKQLMGLCKDGFRLNFCVGKSQTRQPQREARFVQLRGQYSPSPTEQGFKHPISVIQPLSSTGTTSAGMPSIHVCSMDGFYSS